MTDHGLGLQSSLYPGDPAPFTPCDTIHYAAFQIFPDIPRSSQVSPLKHAWILRQLMIVHEALLVPKPSREDAIQDEHWETFSLPATAI